MLPNVMVALLGYALWVTLKHLLKHSVPILPQPSKSEVNHAQLSATKALHLLSMLHSADIVLPTIHGRNIRMRRITEPTAEQTSLPRQLDLSLPDRFEVIRKRGVRLGDRLIVACLSSFASRYLAVRFQANRAEGLSASQV